MSERFGPSEDSIRRMAQMLPSMAEGIKSKSIGYLGLKYAPTAVCAICGKAHSFVNVRNPKLPTSAPCPECSRRLETSTALKSKDGRFAFITSPKFRVGKIVVVKDEEMDRVQQRLRYDKHRQDVEKVLTDLHLLDSEGNVAGWDEDVWAKLEEVGHDAFKCDDCKCSLAT